MVRHQKLILCHDASGRLNSLTKWLFMVSDSHKYTGSNTEEESQCFNPEMEREDKEELNMKVSKIDQNM